MPSLEELNGRLTKVENTPGGGGGGGGSTVVTGSVTVTVPHRSTEHSQTVSAVGVLPTMQVTLQLAKQPDSAENDATMLDIQACSAAAGAGSITVDLAFGERTSGPIIFNFIAS